MLLLNFLPQFCVSLPPTLPIPPLQVVTKPRADLPVLCSCFPLAIYFTFGSVYMSMTLSHFVLAYPSPSPYPQVHSLHLCLYSCPAPRFIRTTFFLDPIHMCQHTVFVFLFLIYFTLCDRLQVHPRDPLQTQGHIQTESEGMEKDIPCKWKLKENWSNNTHIR